MIFFNALLSKITWLPVDRFSSSHWCTSSNISYC